jgi:glycine cleavage system aminomethyltransferase T
MLFLGPEPRMAKLQLPFEHLTPSSLSSLPAYTSAFSVLLNAHGGIIDDTVITKHSTEAFYVVTNAGRREEDLAWITYVPIEGFDLHVARGGYTGEDGFKVRSFCHFPIPIF